MTPYPVLNIFPLLLPAPPCPVCHQPMRLLLSSYPTVDSLMHPAVRLALPVGSLYQVAWCRCTQAYSVNARTISLCRPLFPKWTWPEPRPSFWDDLYD